MPATAPATTGTWVDDAACVGTDPELWFPTTTSEKRGDPYREARAICRTCPVVEPCLADALRVDTEHGAHGMRGMLTPAQRSDLRRRTA